MTLKKYELRLTGEDLDIDGFLAEESIVNIDLIPILEHLELRKKGSTLIINGTLDEANAAIFDPKLQEYLDAVLDDVNNTEVKAKKHREIKAIESCAASVADANTKQTLECILNYLKLLE
jgi:hypothetical protein